MPIIYKIAWLHIQDGLVLSTRSRGKDCYYLPGGKREGQETDAQTLIREIREELTVELDPASLVFAGIFEAHAHGHAVDILVRMSCYYASYTGYLQPASEIEEVVWLRYAHKEQVSAVDQLIFDWLKSQGILAA